MVLRANRVGVPEQIIETRVNSNLNKKYNFSYSPLRIKIYLLYRY